MKCLKPETPVEKAIEKALRKKGFSVVAKKIKKQYKEGKLIHI